MNSCFKPIFFVVSLLILSLQVQAQELALNWKPEPEFGGFYEALLNQGYAKAGLSKFEILPGGAGQPVPQMVAAKKAMFGIAAGDEVILARSQGAKIVALYAVYQEDPQGFMAHSEHGANSLKELFQTKGTIALQKGLSYTLWIEKKFAPIQAKLVPYTGGITSFLQNKDYSQQCFIFSEPIAARREGLKPKTFLISESGFNPYLTVVIAHEDTLKEKPELVKAFLKATRQGWADYLKKPQKTNAAMQKMNPSMDLETFAEATRLQEPFIITTETRKKGLGTMSFDRWKKLYDQMIEIKLVKAGMDITQTFKTID
jgi:NitT/TauT family transport system substrate-binding protein